MNKKFISIVWGYHKQIFSFEKEQNYHMLPIEAMNDEWYECEIFAIDSWVLIEDDPNFIKWTKVIYYNWFLNYLIYLLNNRKNLIYSNSLTLKTLLVGIIGKKTVFYPHSFPFWNNKIKKYIIIFFYYFFTYVRINNIQEFECINKIKNNLAYICPLVVSDKFLYQKLQNKKWWVFIWNLTSIKNPEILIETFKILQKNKTDFNLEIIWEDRYLKHGKNFKDLVMEKWLNDLINVNWFLKPEQIREKLKKSLIYINTSVSEGQCLAVYEWALAGNILCLPRILSFPSVFKDNAFYHDSPENLALNIELILENFSEYKYKIEQNQNMILEKYNYDYIKSEIKKMFLSI